MPGGVEVLRYMESVPDAALAKLDAVDRMVLQHEYQHNETIPRSKGDCALRREISSGLRCAGDAP